MGAGSANLSYIFKEAINSLRTNLASSLLTAFTVGAALAIFSVFLLVFSNLNAAVRGWGDRTQIVAYVRDGLTIDPASVRAGLMQVPGVKTAEYVSKEMALDELRAELKGHESVLDGVDVNPLPASFEIRVLESFREPQKLSTVVERLQKLDWVGDVQYSREWVEKFSAFLKFTEFTAVIIGIFLAAATVFIISNTIRLAVYARKEEIEVMRLVGASDAFIKMPFYIEGIIQGVAGGMLSLLIVGAARYLVTAKLPAYLVFIVASPLPAPVLLVILVGAGAFLGIAGSLISMTKFLKV